MSSKALWEGRRIFFLPSPLENCSMGNLRKRENFYISSSSGRKWISENVNGGKSFIGLWCEVICLDSVAKSEHVLTIDRPLGTSAWLDNDRQLDTHRAPHDFAQSQQVSLFNIEKKIIINKYIIILFSVCARRSIQVERTIRMNLLHDRNCARVQLSRHFLLVVFVAMPWFIQLELGRYSAYSTTHSMR